MVSKKGRPLGGWLTRNLIPAEYALTTAHNAL